ncbi:MAG TPA: aminotransferase class I/II-fold pyridoxal phosphate-dependent enzyme [Chitinophaga sp.]|uniref:pyridoxal phosphate-dependent aminotransferase n=1 Tax=Chitinophaga sp. TaxID=1869181 RepID=UPI002DBC3E63|nr:aminotransferase class I/II-fold pyridoxal phosphate-dependent enzyme [Chitinophaga sp.]HEU4552389.1 aminotransferase class I/II-fold pyridoxal phosphate-dependent enzyme [Chitinophaga sp.]
MNIQVAKRLQHTEEYYFSKKLREIDEMNKAGASVINLGIGSPDLPPHPSVIAALNEYAQKPNTHAYQGYKGIPALRAAMANWYNRFYGVHLDADTEVLPLIGSKEGIMHICMTYLQEGDEALVPNPGYPTYRSAVQLSGATVVDYDLEEKNSWLPDLDALSKKDLGKVKLMWVNYPHMPTGAVTNTGFAKKLIAFAKQHNILICHDNPYSFILNDKPESLLQVEGAKDVVLELNSLSKSSNMAGWRVGMLVGKAAWINEVLRFKSNMDSGMFQPVQMAAVKALELGQDWYNELNAIYRARRKKVFELLELLGCTFDTKQVGMFVWAKIPATAKDGYAITDEILQKAHVFITPGGIFGSNGNGYIRVSLCKDEAVFTEAINRIKEKVKGKK